MTISYHWLSEYLPVKIDPQPLSRILTSVGLEVESLEKYESVKGSLAGLIVGEVLTCEKHPGADKLKLTTVDLGGPAALQIVCGAPNVAVGQKVIVARPGTTIYPLSGEALTLRVAKIRGVESHGMICAEDEIGLSSHHEGILVLPPDVKTGTAAADYFKPYEDFVFEIGLTPNHMDAMSHFGVAAEVCAYLSHAENKELQPVRPSVQGLHLGDNSPAVSVRIENQTACPRYSGLSLKNIQIKASPRWMQERLSAIGVRPINNIVDITNYVLHETGQPLHAFDLDQIHGHKIIIRNLPESTMFITLDEKPRKLSAQDLMICSADEPICIAGVFGGMNSGISATTKNIFLESACFNPADIRKTSVRHGLRTDAASRFEKGTDISGTVDALKRAASLITELAAGEIASDIVDVYPHPKPKQSVTLTYAYLKKLSGKNYSPASVKKILLSLGFDILQDDADEVIVAAPYRKPDIMHAADVTEEIMRMDGYDQIEIPSTISISPSTETDAFKKAYQEKLSDHLAATGFHEILTNSITNSAYYPATDLKGTVKMINNLSAELNVLRPSMLETGLESISYNLNRKNSNLRFFEFGKTYQDLGAGNYPEKEHLCLYLTGTLSNDSWKAPASQADIFYLKGICAKILSVVPAGAAEFSPAENNKFSAAISGAVRGLAVVQLGMVHSSILQVFGIKQPVLFADFDWDLLLQLLRHNSIEFGELPKHLPVHRDLAIIVNKSLAYGEVEKSIREINLNKLQGIRLFDIFESDKWGTGKKSLALSFIFEDPEKTFTDQEVDEMMVKIMVTLEKGLGAEIRK